jgi:hypothetical protein
MKQIKWKTIEVQVSKIKPTPNNFKLKTEVGTVRFKTSVDNFGLAGAVILNSDFTIIDGNTRVEKAKELGYAKIWASIPDRKLTPKEFTEFAAMYDVAKAGEVDMARIKSELGTTDSFFEKWGLEIPTKAMDKLKTLETTKIVKTTPSKPKPEKKESSLRPISLQFTSEEANEYLNIAESMYQKFGVDNVTDLSLKAIKQLSSTSVALQLSKTQLEEFRSIESRAKYKLHTKDTSETILKILRAYDKR